MANKYLDITGVSTLWNAIKGRDEEVRTSLTTLINGQAAGDDNEAILGKGSELVYENKHIVLKDASGNSLGSIDASPFISDGMLDDVEIYTAKGNEVDYNGVESTTGDQFIKFTWNTTTGNKVDYIKLSDISKTYSGSTTIGINTDENNSIYVKEVGADIVKTNKIVLGGTPLGDYIKANSDLTEIAAGDLTNVLTALLSADIYPEDYKMSGGTLSVSFGKPTYSFSSSTTPVEVGTKITFNATCPAASASGSYTFSGFDNGYATEVDGTVNANNPSSISLTGVTTNNDQNKLSFTVNGFNGKTIADITGTNASPAKLENLELTVSETTNNYITINATSPSFKAKTPTIPDYYAVSSLGNTSETEKLAGKAASEIFDKTATSVTTSTSTVKIDGQRKLFYGTSTTSCVFATSANIRALGNDSFYKSSLTITIPAGTNDVVLAMPSAWSITKIVDNGTNYEITSNLSKVDDTGVSVEGKNSYTATKYFVYRFTPDAAMDATTWTLSLSK